MRALARETRSLSGQLLGIGSPTTLAFNLLTDPVNERLCRQFDSEVANYSHGNWRVAAASGPLDVRHEYHYDAIKAAQNTDIYDDFTHDANMPHGCQVVLVNDGQVMVGLAVLRTFQDGRTTEADRAVFTQAAPLMQSAVRMQRTLEGEGAKLLAGSLDTMNTAAFVCDGLGRVCATTRAGEALLRAEDLIMLRDERLTAPNSAEARELRMQIGAMLQAGDLALPSCGVWLGQQRPIAQRRLCEIFRLPAKPAALGFEPRLLVTVRAAGNIGAMERQALQRMMGLTRAETEIAMLLAEGTSREMIALQRSTSLGTVNIQIKRLFEKTGTNREAELVALINRLLR
ncbi:DNA-binding CsgD family transcriptional regulator [Sphingobium sp. B2D3A]|uniref:helix-turn-helix transcriptional regulator n=1 Tax=unclassified Sphingobium TaxID=2611147 RepID=UPI0022256B71|nr:MULTISPECIES: helix-turn-helix transcriptional regulator [unclassified Sphingobium]MCW2335875.1 DNA-binding CsgD family transcriptional regulator [Sphingobium sp. B2D3A]MCW2385634.1 DNA-binding CsgD family transcriptional regulator [Sphingobium sp. B2D3D]